MNALVFHGPGERSWDSVPDPAIAAETDAIVRIDSSTICGTDLHILKGDVPEVEPGTILGHEAVGTVVETGTRRHDPAGGRPRPRVLHHVLRPLPLLPGGPLRPLHRRRRLDPRPPDQRPPGRVRTRPVRRHVGPQAAAGDRATSRRCSSRTSCPTAYEVGVLNGGVRPGRHRRHRRRRPDRARRDHDREAVHAGPDRRARRRRRAARARAARSARTSSINNGETDPAGARSWSSRTGWASTSPSRQSASRRRSSSARSIVRPGGHVANVGVHGAPATLHLEKLWIKDVTITTGLVDTSTTPRLLELIANGRLDPTPFATHRFELADTEQAYETFADAASTNALKVVLSAAPSTAGRKGARFRDPCRNSCLTRQRTGRSTGRPVPPPPGRVDVILRDGGTLRLRPPGSEDAEALLGFFSGLSERSLYLRFHGAPTVQAVARRAVPRAGLGRARAPSSARSPAADGEQIVALASYARLRDPASAEVAFAVADDQQGRGIGTRMLEQLAERAAAVGIERFVAEVMGENAAMMRVFEDAGFGVSRALDRGTFEVAFPIEPTDAYRGHVEERDHLAVVASLRPFFAPDERRRDRCVDTARGDRRHRLPERPRRRVQGRRVPGQPNR